jgi:hypothetical protein
VDRPPEEQVIPRSNASWQYCIEKKCGIVLSADFIRRRSASLASEATEETIRLRKLYGDSDWLLLRERFSRAERELADKGITP